MDPAVPGARISKRLSSSNALITSEGSSEFTSNCSASLPAASIIETAPPLVGHKATFPPADASRIILDDSDLSFSCPDSALSWASTPLMLNSSVSTLLLSLITIVELEPKLKILLPSS